MDLLYVMIHKNNHNACDVYMRVKSMIFGFYEIKFKFSDDLKFSLQKKILQLKIILFDADAEVDYLPHVMSFVLIVKKTTQSPLFLKSIFNSYSLFKIKNLFLFEIFEKIHDKKR